MTGPQVRFTEDWVPGDLGICIVTAKGNWKHLHTGESYDGPDRHETVRVVEVTMIEDWPGLRLRGYGDAWFQGDCFRKIPPETREERRASWKTLWDSNRHRAPEKVDA